MYFRRWASQGRRRAGLAFHTDGNAGVHARGGIYGLRAGDARAAWDAGPGGSAPRSLA